MKNEKILRELLSLQKSPITYQSEKMLRRVIKDDEALLMDGINDIAQSGFAVTMQTRFFYDLEEEFGDNPPRFYFINASFLGDEILSDTFTYEGIRFYFGIEKVARNNRLTLIFTKVKKVSFETGEFISTDFDYYIPKDTLNGDWEQITVDQAKELKENLRETVSKINVNGKKRYTIDGYFIGNHALRNVLSASPQNEYNIKVSKKGVKLYLGLSRDNMVNNYEVDLLDKHNNDVESSQGELQLILVGMDEPALGPLASFTKIYATLETDVIQFEDGVENKVLMHSLLGTGGNCVVNSRDFPATNHF